MDRRPPFPADFQLVVASQSPRRHSLLGAIGVPFTVVPSAAEEVLEGGPASALAERNAVAKVRGSFLPADVPSGAFVLGTDTLVTLDDRLMGKPSSAAEATHMLTSLSGRTHQVVSGVALARTAASQGAAGPGGTMTTGEIRVASAVTDVTFLPLRPADVEAYIASAEWEGKAGAYAIQGLAGSFVSEVWGEYSNVVGLPLCLLARMLREAGFDLLRRVWL
ncbi:MAG: Maf family protein [bacterium]